MKAKLQAGAELDFLTKTELVDVLRSWAAELTRGPRFLRRSYAGTVDGDGTLTIYGDGPADGFTWAVTRVAVHGVELLQSVSVYTNEPAPSALALPRVDRVEYPGDHGLVLVSGDSLVIAGESLTAGGRVTVTVQIKETPALMAWSL